MSDLAKQNAQLVKDYLEAINGWDFGAMRVLLHPEISYELPFAPEQFPRVTKGLDATIEFIHGVTDFIDPENLHDITVEAYATDANELLAEYKSATRIKATNREYRNNYVVRVTVRDGKIVRFAEYFDPIKLVIAMGGSVSIPS
jgi:ketosteroid isomerase-like protein